jgi:uncharacterized protein YceK
MILTLTAAGRFGFPFLRITQTEIQRRGQHMNTRHIASAAIVAAIGIALSGCATVITQMHQDLSVTTPTAEGASCSLQNVRGMWTVQTPGKVTVLKSKDDMQVRCTKDGFQDAQGVALVGIAPWFWGNFVIGGLLGMGLDWSTGSIHKYRENVVVPMKSSGAAANTAPAPTQRTTTARNGAPTN